MKLVNRLILSVLVLCGSITLTAQNSEKINPSKNCYKTLECSNPISSNVFCADPTGVEYNGRLYVYGTNDNQQYETVGENGKNTYEHIKSIVCFSTDDMINWTYHGKIDVKKIAPWIISSWAPSIVSRVEEDGLTHFYLYFSNNGCGVGVITSTNPAGPWYDVLEKPLITTETKGLGDVPNPFDPGVCIDDKGCGYLAFGGGVAKNGDNVSPKTSRIARLGKDMVSIDTIVEINAPYFYEASELNVINGTYIYTFNNNWVERMEWNYKVAPMPPLCSMSYMTTKTPMVSESWKYKGHYFPNPGDVGMNYSNNHTHFMKYKGEYYIFYHSMILQEFMTTKGGFRSLCVNKLQINDRKEKLVLTNGTRKGVEAIKTLSPYESQAGTTMFTSADIWYESDSVSISSKSMSAGAWLCVRNVEFTNCKLWNIVAKGEGILEIRLDKVNASPIAKIDVKNTDFTELQAQVSAITGIHDVYFVFSDANILLKSWNCKD